MLELNYTTVSTFSFFITFLASVRSSRVKRNISCCCSTDNFIYML